MRRIFLLLLAAFAIVSCGVEKAYGPLYYWGGSAGSASVYEDLTYNDYKKQSPEALCKFVCAYEDMIKNPGGSRQIPPPGICAEYGYLLLQPDTATKFIKTATPAQMAVFGSVTDFDAVFAEKGRELLEMEIKYYPESATFILPLLKRLSR